MNEPIKPLWKWLHIWLLCSSLTLQSMVIQTVGVLLTDLGPSTVQYLFYLAKSICKTRLTPKHYNHMWFWNCRHLSAAITASTFLARLSTQFWQQGFTPIQPQECQWGQALMFGVKTLLNSSHKVFDDIEVEVLCWPINHSNAFFDSTFHTCWCNSKCYQMTDIVIVKLDEIIVKDHCMM